MTFTAFAVRLTKRMYDRVLSAICGERPFFHLKKGIAFVHISRYAPLDAFLVGVLYPCLERVLAVHLFCAHAL